MQLLWQRTTLDTVGADRVLARAMRDGTTVLILARLETWLGPIARATGTPEGTSFKLGGDWLGGQYFAKDHPLFAGLPVNQALNWPYQGVVGGDRMAFHVPGEEIIAGAYQTWPMQLGSAVSILHAGKGRIILSGLDIVKQLHNQDTSAEVARRLFCKFVNYATPKR